MSAVRQAESRAEQMPSAEKEAILKEDEIETVNEREQLYVDVLYTIANCVGCQQPGGQVKFIVEVKNQFIKLFLFPTSLLIIKMKCTIPLSVLSEFHLIDIIDYFTQRLRKSLKSSSYQ